MRMSLAKRDFGGASAFALFATEQIMKYLTFICTLTVLIATIAPAKIVFQSYRDGKSELYVMEDNGSNLQRLTHSQLGYSHPTWSPDGKQIVFNRDIGQNNVQQHEVFLINADGTAEHQLTHHSAPDTVATGAWSPDGHSIVFSSNRSGDREIYVMDIESGDIRQLTNDGGTGASWAPNGKYIAFERSAALFGRNIWVMSADGRNQKPLLPAPKHMVTRFAPRWAPDSTRILFTESAYDAAAEGFKILSTQVMIRHKNLDTQQRVKLPKAWRIHFTCWISNDEIVFSADETGIRTKKHGNYDIYRYHLRTQEITKLTNHPEVDYTPHWAPGPLSVSPVGKLGTQWGKVK